MTESELREASDFLAEQILKQHIKAQIASSIATRSAQWSPIPADQRWWMKPLIDATTPLGD